MAQRDHDLGVLLVHGIGEQGRGTTLTGWGDALLGWFTGWLGDDGVRVGDADLAPAGDEAAYLTVELDLPVPEGDDGASAHDPGPSRWLVVEAWWAEAFGPPRFGEVAVWGFQVVPWIFTAHYASRLRRTVAGLRDANSLRRRLRALARIAVQLGLLAVAIVLSPFLALAVGGVTLLSAVPIDRVRRLAASAQGVLSRSLGDSFVLLDSPTRARAIERHVERAAMRLVERCDRLAVVAHSQGAVVAHRALRALRPDRLASFITFGSGHNKLAPLGPDNRAPVRKAWLAPLGVLLLALGAWEAWADWRAGVEDAYWQLVMIGSLALPLLGVGIGAAWSADRQAATPERLAIGTARWRDLYARRDPVPNGPLFGTPKPDHGLWVSDEVVNRDSLVRDHGTYWANGDEFVTCVVQELATSAGRSVVTDADERAAQALARRRRRWRVGWLVAARWAAILAASGILAANLADLERLGRQSVEIAARLTALLPLVDWTAPDLGDGAARAAAAAGVVAATGAGYRLVVAMWDRWDHGEQQRFLHRHGFALWPVEFAVFVTSAVALLAVGLTVAATTPAQLLAGLRNMVLVVIVWLLWYGLLLMLFGGALRWLGLSRTDTWSEGTITTMVTALVVGASLLLVIDTFAAANIVIAVTFAFAPPLAMLLLPRLGTASTRAARLRRRLEAVSASGPLPIAAQRLPDPPVALALDYADELRGQLEAALAPAPAGDVPEGAAAATGTGAFDGRERDALAALAGRVAETATVLDSVGEQDAAEELRTVTARVPFRVRLPR